MSTINKVHKKLYIILAIAIIIAALVAGFFIWYLSNSSSVSKTLTLGNEYLSDLNYDSAIKEYSKVLVVDPINEEALIGLVQSYTGQGNSQMVDTLIRTSPILASDTETLKKYASLLDEIGNYKQELEILDSLVAITDEDEFYEKKEEVLEKAMNQNYLFASNEDHEACISNGAVQTMGTNVLGALGTDKDIRIPTQTGTFSDAAFPGTAKSVFVTGSCTAVVDTNDTLWLAGSNRSGQKATKNVELIAQSGWTEITSLTGVVKVAGTNGATFALTKQGRLFMVGANDGFVYGNAWQDEWTEITGYGTISDIQCNGEFVAFLTSSGRIYGNTGYYYGNYSNMSKVWMTMVSDAQDFAMTDNCFIYSSSDGTITDYYGTISFPSEWEVNDEYGYYLGYQAPYEIIDIATADNRAYLLDSDGILHSIYEGKENVVDQTGKIVSIYSSGNYCVAQFEDGSYQLYDVNGGLFT